MNARQHIIDIIRNRTAELSFDCPQPTVEGNAIFFDWSRAVENEGTREARIGIGSFDQVVGITSDDSPDFRMFVIDVDAPGHPPNMSLDEAIEYIRHFLWADRS